MGHYLGFPLLGTGHMRQLLHLVSSAIREMADELKHADEWNDPQWEDSVTYAADQAGDFDWPLIRHVVHHG